MKNLIYYFKTKCLSLFLIVLEFSVKIFIGVEYECPRGHRFMCSAPDKILTTSSNGIVKENGNKVSNSDMPLYFPCPCRYYYYELFYDLKLFYFC